MLHKAIYKGEGVSLGERYLDPSVSLEVYSSLKKNNPYFQEALRLNDNAWAMRSRLRKRIEFLCQSDCLFLTLTFTDDVLASTSEKTRKDYIRKFLKDHSSGYVANIDYGGKNDREHYHAIVQTGYIDSHDYPYGNLDFRRIRCSGGYSYRLSKYINKLVNHAVKDTAKQNRVIYSRNLSGIK